MNQKSSKNLLITFGLYVISVYLIYPFFNPFFQNITLILIAHIVSTLLVILGLVYNVKIFKLKESMIGGVLLLLIGLYLIVGSVLAFLFIL